MATKKNKIVIGVDVDTKQVQLELKKLKAMLGKGTFGNVGAPNVQKGVTSSIGALGKLDSKLKSTKAMFDSTTATVKKFSSPTVRKGMKAMGVDLAQVDKNVKTASIGLRKLKKRVDEYTRAIQLNSKYEKVRANDLTRAKTGIKSTTQAYDRQQRAVKKMQREMSKLSDMRTDFRKQGRDVSGLTDRMKRLAGAVARVSPPISRFHNKLRKLNPTLGKLWFNLKRGKGAMRAMGDATRASSFKMTHMVARSILLVGVLGGVFTAVNAIKSAFKEAFSSVEDYRKSIASLTAFTLTFMKTDPGETIASQYQRASLYAKRLFKVMEDIAATTLMTGDQVNLISSIMLRNGVAIDTNNKKHIDSFKAIGNAVLMVTAGQDQERQLQSEISNLMTGNIKSQDRLGKMLQATTPNLKKQLAIWREQGKVLEGLGGLLKGFSITVKDIENTWQVVSSLLLTTFKQTVRGGMVEAFDDMLDIMRSINDYIKEHQALIQYKLRAGYLGIKETVVGIYKWFMKWKGLLADIVMGAGGFWGLTVALKSIRGVMLSIALISGNWIKALGIGLGVLYVRIKSLRDLQNNSRESFKNATEVFSHTQDSSYTEDASFIKKQGYDPQAEAKTLLRGYQHKIAPMIERLSEKIPELLTLKPADWEVLKRNYGDNLTDVLNKLKNDPSLMDVVISSRFIRIDKGVLTKRISSQLNEALGAVRDHLVLPKDYMGKLFDSLKASGTRIEDDVLDDMFNKLKQKTIDFSKTAPAGAVMALTMKDLEHAYGESSRTIEFKKISAEADGKGAQKRIADLYKLKDALMSVRIEHSKLAATVAGNPFSAAKETDLKTFSKIRGIQEKINRIKQKDVGTSVEQLENQKASIAVLKKEMGVRYKIGALEKKLAAEAREKAFLSSKTDVGIETINVQESQGLISEKDALIQTNKLRRDALGIEIARAQAMYLQARALGVSTDELREYALELEKLQNKKVKLKLLPDEVAMNKFGNDLKDLFSDASAESATGYLKGLDSFLGGDGKGGDNYVDKLLDVSKSLQNIPVIGELYNLVVMLLTFPKMISDSIKGFMKALFDFPKVLLEMITTIFEDLPLAITRVFENLIDYADKFIIGLVKALPRFLKAMMLMIPRIIKAIIIEVPQIINALVRAVPYLISAIGKGLYQVFLSVVDLLFGWIPGVNIDSSLDNDTPTPDWLEDQSTETKALTDSIIGLKESIDKTLYDLLTGSANPADVFERLEIARQDSLALANDFASATGAEKVELGGQLHESLKGYLTLAQEAYQRPSNEYQAIFKNVIGNLESIQSSVGNIDPNADLSLPPLDSYGSVGFPKVDIMGGISNIIGSVGEIIGDALNSALAWLLDLPNLIGESISNALEWLLDLPRMIVDAIAGLLGMDTITDAVGNFTDNVTNFVSDPVGTTFGAAKDAGDWVGSVTGLWHKGGIIKAHSGRFLGEDLGPKEIPIIALQGEGVLNAYNGMNAIGGEAGLNYANRTGNLAGGGSGGGDVSLSFEVNVSTTGDPEEAKQAGIQFGEGVIEILQSRKGVAAIRDANA